MGAPFTTAVLAPNRKIAIAAGCVVCMVAAWSIGVPNLAHRPPHAQDLALSEQAALVVNLVLEQRSLEEGCFLSLPDGEGVELYAKKWNESRAQLADAIARVSELDLNEQDRHAVRQIAADYRVHVDGYMRVMSMIHSGKIRTPQQAREHISIYQDSARRMEANATAVSARARQRIGKAI